MKKTIIFSIVALVAMGSIINGCSKDESLQPEPEKNVITLTVSIGLGGNTKTKALTTDLVKTFAAGETMALVYKNTSGNTVKVESVALENSDIIATGDLATDKKSAKFTFNITEVPDKTKDVTYIYPAAMAKADGTVNYDALENDQDGTWATLSSNFDFCTKTAAWDEESLPNCTLENQFAICAFDLKSGENKINEDITSMTISDGTNSYVVNRTPSSDKIYVVIRPTNSPLSITTTIGGTHYCKSSTYRPYVAGNGYVLTLKMISLTSFDLKYGSFDQDKDAYIYQTGAATESTDHTITIHAGRTVVLNGVNIKAVGESDANLDVNAINCLGSATIVLNGTNTVINKSRTFATIKAGPYGDSEEPQTTLTICGDGVLNVSSLYSESSTKDEGALIGSDQNGKCGNIVIAGGTINATGKNDQQSAAIGAGRSDNNSKCGNITICGGTVNANSGTGAGIGSGCTYGGESNCGDIIITGGIIDAKSVSGAAIGSGSKNSGTASKCRSISISGGSVTAKNTTNGSAIGSGSKGEVGDITISGGSVTAKNTRETTTNGGAGIGCGYYAKCGAISIIGGDVKAQGGPQAAGIGSAKASNSSYSNCGTITITLGIKEVVVTKNATGVLNIIGKGYNHNNSSCTSVIFNNTTMYDGTSWVVTPDAGNHDGLTLTTSDNTWTLTPTPTP